MKAVDVVQSQLEAYNDRHLQRFLATFSDTVKAYRMPASEPSISGKAQLGEFYATQRFNRPALKAEVVNRIVCGNKVIDHERIWGLGDSDLELVVVYEVTAGLIQSVWFFAPS